MMFVSLFSFSIMFMIHILHLSPKSVWVYIVVHSLYSTQHIWGDHDQIALWIKPLIDVTAAFGGSIIAQNARLDTHLPVCRLTHIFHIRLYNNITDVIKNRKCAGVLKSGSIGLQISSRVSKRCDLTFSKSQKLRNLFRSRKLTYAFSSRKWSN